MTNSILKIQKGAATLLLTMIMLVTATLIIIFAASYSRMQQKIVSNQYQSSQSYEAAEAGIEFGVVYFQQNSAAILANPVGGHIPAYSNSSTTNVTLGNNSKYTIVYSNPIANNYNLIRITSTGTNADGTSTKVMVQDIAFVSMLSSPPTVPIIVQGGVTMSGNAEVSNFSNTTTIVSGGSLTMSGNASTETASGGSSAGHIRSDIQQNVASIAAMTSTQFFAQYFAAGSGAVKNAVDTVYTSNYSAANGSSGTSIWIDQAASFAGNTTIGTSSNPVLLIVNGNLNVSGNLTVYGFVYVIGNIAISGNAEINGALTGTGTLSTSGNGEIIFNNNDLTQVQQLGSMSNWGKVPGSWKDY
ncbi:MAG: hypothetical protein P4M12_04185 [Gammaproteobacteria bacterium]|nr:hypothetical protein [Gammaproteobacteria bacterium]